MQQKRYEVRVQLTPQTGFGDKPYYWQIVQITKDGTYTVAHGWAEDYDLAWVDANTEAEDRGIV